MGRARFRMAWVLVLGLLVTGALGAGAPAANAPIEITFVKSFDQASSSYKGTTGDGGTIEMWVSNSLVTGSMQHFDVRLEASPASGGSFTAELRGTFNFSTAETLLTGTVTEGWLAGARAREQGMYLGGGTFAGTLWLMPGSA